MNDRRVNGRAATLVVGIVLVVVSFVVYLLSARQFDAGRGDLFWLADAFLKGRTWLDAPLGPNDVVYGPSGEVFVPFAPFPAIVFMPLVALIGPVNADLWEPIINAAGASTRVGGGCSCGPSGAVSTCPFEDGLQPGHESYMVPSAHRIARKASLPSTSAFRKFAFQLSPTPARRPRR